MALLITEVQELVGKTITEARREGPDIMLHVARGGKRWYAKFVSEDDAEHDHRVTLLTEEMSLAHLYYWKLATREEVREKLKWLVEHDQWEELSIVVRELSQLKEVAHDRSEEER